MKKHGIPCRIHVSDFEEIFEGKTPRATVLHNAVGKADLVAKHYEGKNYIVIGVDTVGVIKNEILGKAKNRSSAKKMLLKLSGKAHKVLSGLCVINALNGKRIKTVVTTKVIFRRIGEAELEKYLNSGQWKGKAGSYAVQGRAKGFVEKIVGDITNVVGIPIETLKTMLDRI